MEGFGEEERIIARILKGEISFSDREIKNLASADLSEKEEEQLFQLATEIQEKIKQNKELRKDVEEKANVEEKDLYKKLDLFGIDDEIKAIKTELNETEIGLFKNVTKGVIATISFGILMPIIVSIFTSSLVPLLITLVSGITLGIVPCVLIEKKILSNRKALKEKILKLETERLNSLGYKSENMFESDIERTKNAAKHVYNSRKFDMTDDEIAKLF